MRRPKDLSGANEQLATRSRCRVHPDLAIGPQKGAAETTHGGNWLPPGSVVPWGLWRHPRAYAVVMVAMRDGRFAKAVLHFLRQGTRCRRRRAVAASPAVVRAPPRGAPRGRRVGRGRCRGGVLLQRASASSARWLAGWLAGWLARPALGLPVRHCYAMRTNLPRSTRTLQRRPLVDTRHYAT